MTNNNFFIFSLGHFRYALGLDKVERVTRAAAVTPLPDTHGNIHGVIDVHGEIMPVINSRRVFGLPEMAITPDDIFVIVHTDVRDVILVVDGVEQATEISTGELTKAADIIPEYPGVESIARLDSGIIVIHDLERCLAGQLQILYEMPETQVAADVA